MENKIQKILVFYNQILTPFLGSGGDVRCAESIMKWNRFEVEIIGPKIAKFLKKKLKAKYFYCLPNTIIDNLYQKKKSVFLIAFLYIRRTLDAMKLVKRINPEIIYTTGDFLCNTFPSFIFKKRNPQTVWVANIFHINLPPIRRKQNKFLYALFSFLFQRVSLLLIRKADLVFLLNHIVREYLIQIGFQQEKLITLGAGIDIPKINKVKVVKPRENNVFFFGRINLTKGIFDLPKIWPIVLKNVPDSHLILIGDGEESVVKNLKYEFLKVGVLESIKFSGFIEKNEEVYKILKTGKVFILPSYEEGWSIAVFEAIACGLLPIVHDLPVFNEIFGKKIKTIPVGNIFVFAETIISFLKNDELRKKYVTNLSKEIKRYDWSIVAKKEENEIFKINAMKKLCLPQR